MSYIIILRFFVQLIHKKLQTVPPGQCTTPDRNGISEASLIRAGMVPSVHTVMSVHPWNPYTRELMVSGHPSGWVHHTLATVQRHERFKATKTRHKRALHMPHKLWVVHWYKILLIWILVTFLWWFLSSVSLGIRARLVGAFQMEISKRMFDIEWGAGLWEQDLTGNISKESHNVPGMYSFNEQQKSMKTKDEAVTDGRFTEGRRKWARGQQHILTHHTTTLLFVLMFI